MKDPTLKAFKLIRHFDELITQAINTCKGKPVVRNLLLQHTFSTSLLKHPPGQLEQKAKLWQQPQVPKNLYINHGHFIHAKGDGIQHIIDELKRKGDSNRALYSLISMPEIVGKGDLPIPSFMVLQFGLSGKSLFCTAYFRALEVCRFLPINVTEICLVASRIHRDFQQVNRVYLCILAFQASYKPDFDCLEKCELDQMEEGVVSGYLADPTKKDKLSHLLHDKLRESTVIDTARLNEICNYLRNAPAETRALYKDTFLSSLERARDCLNELKEVRENTSYSPEIQKLTEQAKQHLKAAFAAM